MSQNIAWFLGIAGEQNGPFTEDEVAAKIRALEVPDDALVWHDALPDWSPIHAVPELWQYFDRSEAEGQVEEGVESPDGEGASLEVAQDDLPPPPTSAKTIGLPPPPSDLPPPPAFFTAQTVKVPTSDDLLARPLTAVTEDEEALDEEPVEETSTDQDEEQEEEEGELGELEAEEGEEEETPKAKAKSQAKKKKAREDDFMMASFAGADDTMETVFRSDGKAKKKSRINLRIPKSAVVAMLFLLALAGGAFAVFTGAVDPNEIAQSANLDEILKMVGLGDLVPEAPQGKAAKFKPAAPTKGGATAPGAVAGNSVTGNGKAPAAPAANAAAIAARFASVKKAQEDMLADPEGALASLRKIAKENYGDEAGTQAIDAAVGYLQTTRRGADAAKLLIEASRPLEAAKMYLEEPPSYVDAEKALYMAWEKGADPTKADHLVQDIDLVLSKLDDQKLAETRIRTLSETYPVRAKVYGYYLKSRDEKISDMFARLSGQFVQGLIAHITTEFPQITLVGRPSVAIVREKPDQYRLVGRYAGRVQLSRDVLDDVRFVFWSRDDIWYLIETNLTKEREVASRSERARRGEVYYRGDELLAMLEGAFTKKYPGTELHKEGKEAKLREE